MDYFLSHIKDLSDRSYNRNCFEFSSFLNGEEQSKIYKIKNELTFYTFFGGTVGCERQIIRFGNEEDLGYSENFPIATIKITPANKKFTDTLSHRDILGSLMNLGIERNNIGDIFITDNATYVFVLNKLSDYICDNLIKIRHTTVKCEVITEPPTEVFSNIQEINIIISSMRLDCIVSSVFNFSRNKTNELFKAEKIFVNSMTVTNNSLIPKTDDIISVRGFGKFIIGEINGNTKKGRIVLAIKKYI